MNRFNRTTQHDRRLTRRALMAAGSTAAIALGMPAAGQAGAETAVLSYVYSAVEGSFIAESEEDDRRAELTLMGATEFAVYVVDQPERSVGLLAMEALVSLWPFPANDPPNAALVFNDEDGRPKSLILEVQKPEYDAGQRLLRAPVLRLRDRFEESFSSNSLGMSNLFINPAIVPGEAPIVYGADDWLFFAHRFNLFKDRDSRSGQAAEDEED